MCFVDSTGKLLFEKAGACAEEEAGVKLLNILLDKEYEMTMELAGREIKMIDNPRDPEFIKRVESSKFCNHCHKKLHLKKKRDTDGHSMNYDVEDHDRKLP